MKILGTRWFLPVAACIIIAAMTTTPRQRDQVSAPVRGSDVGVSPGSQIYASSDDELADDLRTASDLGLTWIRIDIDWSGIESEQGSFDWEATDRLIDAAVANDLTVLGLLAYTPEWARPTGTSSKHRPNDIDDFARFAEIAAERYGGRVAAWEVWNEPNSVLFWEPEPDPVDYARLLIATVERLRLVDPDAIVMTGGLAPATDSPPEEISPERFLLALHDEIEPGLIDAVAIHPYSFPADPSDTTKDWNLFGRLPGIAELVATAEGRPVPIWLTEFGAPFDPVDPERQAEIIAEGLVCADRWPWAGPIFVYALRDASLPDELPFGILDADGELRPSAVRIRAQLELAPSTIISSNCPT